MAETKAVINDSSSVQGSLESLCRCPNPEGLARTSNVLRDSSPWMVDARGNIGTHRFILVPATGSYIQQGVCECTVLSCTGGACSSGYKQGERGREAPKSLLEEEWLKRVPMSGLGERMCSASRLSVVFYRMS